MLKPGFVIAAWLAPLCFAAVVLADSCVGADEGGGDKPLATDSSVPEPAREAPYGPARFLRETLEAESLRDSLGNLSEMTLFENGLMTRSDVVIPRFPMRPDVGRHDIKCIMGNKRVLKLLKELADLPKAEAGALVQEHLMAALSKYQSGFRKSYSPDKIGIVRVVNVKQLEQGEVAAPTTRYTPRYEILSLAFIAGHLELKSAFPAIVELAQYAKEQREYLYQCYLTDKISEDRAYHILVDGGLYNRLVICTALLGTRGGEREGTSAEKPRSRGILFTTQKFPAYDAFLVPRDPRRWPPEPMEPKIEVSFVGVASDGYLDSILAAVTK